jgi:two-component system phosphate regulon sensor histidine kinase PhoR
MKLKLPPIPSTNIIIVIITVSLIGITLTQVYWMKKAYDLKEEQFNNTLAVTLKSVARQLQIRYSLLNKPLPEVYDIDNTLLNAIVFDEFACMNIYKNYYFGIIDHENKKVIKGKPGNFTDNIIESPNQIPLIEFDDPQRFSLGVYFSNQSQMILVDMVLWLVLSVFFVIIFIFTYVMSTRFFLKQKQLSEMKSDFVNNMTHELKTPIATISLASDMLSRDNILGDLIKAKRYINVINDENTRLQNQVEQVLNITLLDKGKINLKKKEIDIHKIVVKTVSNFILTVKKRNGMIATFMNAKETMILGDREHLRNVFANLLDNANKYSPEHPQITVSTMNVDQGILISVEDRGIGISQENQKMIFKKLYRVPTGNVQDTRGYGLGLYYVKSIVDRHNGTIKVTSELGKGTKFDVYLPFKSKSDTVITDE